jgi:hypothetical protein
LELPVVTLLDRVKERTDSDLGDPELQRLVDEALKTVLDRFGPNADTSSPITVMLEGRRRMLDLARPIDLVQPVTIVESVKWGELALDDDWSFAGEDTTTLTSTDWRAWHEGRSLERLPTGPNSRWLWGSRVVITYVPQNDGNARQEVIIKLVQLDLNYGGGLNSQSIGDTSLNFLDYDGERERLLRSLAPRKGLFVR